MLFIFSGIPCIFIYIVGHLYIQIQLNTLSFMFSGTPCIFIFIRTSCIFIFSGTPLYVHIHWDTLYIHIHWDTLYIHIQWDTLYIHIQWDTLHVLTCNKYQTSFPPWNLLRWPLLHAPRTTAIIKYKSINIRVFFLETI